MGFLLALEMTSRLHLISDPVRRSSQELHYLGLPFVNLNLFQVPIPSETGQCDAELNSA